MNCSTIDSILDDHRMPRVSAAERQAVAAHVERCGRCAGVLVADEVLASEHIGEPPPELFARVLGQLDAARTQAQTVRSRSRLVTAAAAAVVAVVALVTGFTLLERAPGADAALTAPPTAAAPVAPRFVAGRAYEVLPGAAPLARISSGVPVTEFFTYLCFPCYAVEPELERFREATGGRVEFARVPALFNSEAELHARAFYAAEELGKLDAMHTAFYEEIHVRGNRLTSRAALADFFARFGVAEAAFSAAFDSPAVEAKLQQALALSREYAIEATPTIVVAGRYVTNPSMAGAALLEVVGGLVAGEGACQTRCDGRSERRDQCATSESLPC